MKSFIKVCLGIAIIFIFLFNIDLSSISIILKNLTIINLSTLGFLIILSTIPTLLRWIFITKRNYINLSISKLTYFYYASFLFNSVSPANLGGDLYRLLTIKKEAKNLINEVVNVLLQERFYGFISLFFIILLGLIFSQNKNLFPNTLFFEIGIYFCCCILILTLGFKKNIVFQLNKVRIFQKALKYLNLNNTNFLYDSVILMLSISGFIFWAAAVFFVCYQLDMGLSIFNILIIAALVEIIRFAPLTFQGIGIREPSFAYFASEFFGSSFDLAFLAGLIIYLYLSIINLFLGFCFYTFKKV